MNNFRIEIITILMIRNSRKVLLVFATLWVDGRGKSKEVAPNRNLVQPLERMEVNNAPQMKA